MRYRDHDVWEEEEEKEDEERDEGDDVDDVIDNGDHILGRPEDLDGDFFKDPKALPRV